MKRFFTYALALAAMLAGGTSAWAGDYPTNYSASDNSTHSARYTRSLTVSVDGEDTQISLSSAAYSPLYYDRTQDVTVTAKPGSDIQLAADFSDRWMNAYAYVDMDNDGQFSYAVDEENHKALSTSDLRAFSFYSFSSSSDLSGYNSEGDAISGDGRSVWTLAPFSAPTAEGAYRVRFKIDWNNIDPAGATSSSRWGSLQANGGVIVDFTLKVEGGGASSTGKSVPYAIDFSESQDGWTAVDMSETAGKTWAYSTNGFYYDGKYYACVAMTPDYSSAYNDYYVSPAISLEAGKTYEVKTLAFATGSSAVVKLCKGTSDADMTAMEEIATLTTPSDYYASAEETNEVSVDADGDYYFAFLGTTEQYAPYWAYLMSFSISEKNGGTTVDPSRSEAALPYSINFGESQEGWVATDNNADGSTWAPYEGIGVAVEKSEVNDDCISPYFSLEAGKSYTVTTKVQGANVNESAQLSLLAGTSEDALAVVKDNMTVPGTGEQVEENVFSPTESGKYCFALREVISEENADAYAMPLYLVSFAVEEADNTEEEGNPVFTSDFTGDNPADGWYILDDNADNVTWAAATSGIAYDGDAAQGAANDLLATSPFDVVSGHDYLVETTFEQSGAFDPDKVNIHWGESPYLDEEPTTIAEEELYATNGLGTIEKAYRFTSDYTGKIYIGIRLHTSAPNGTLAITSLKVTPIAKAVPQPVENLAGEVNSGDKTVTLTWKNPSADTRQLPISGTLKANIYQDGALVAATDALTPGAEASYVLTPATFSGNATFVVKAVIENKESEGAGVTVNLDDQSGDETLVKQFDVNRDNSSEWVIEDIAGTSSWAYDYSNVFRFSYSLGQKTDNDWLISPSVYLEKGIRYIAKYELKTAQDYATSVDVTLGKEQNSSAQTQVIGSHPALKQNGFGQFETAQFSVSETGDYHVGFHVFEADYSVSMRNLSIYSVGAKPSAIERTQAGENVSYDARTATLILSAQGGDVDVYDMQGRLALHAVASQGTLSVGTLPAGVYVVRTARQSFKIAK